MDKEPPKRKRGRPRKDDLVKAKKLLKWSPKVDLKDWIIQFKREHKIN